MRVLTVTEKLKLATDLFNKHKLVVEHPGLSYALQIEELRIITKLLSEHGLSTKYAKQCSVLQGISELSEGKIPVAKKEDDGNN